MTFEKVEINTWKPENANEEVSGLFIKAESEVGTNNSMLYSMEVDEKPIAVWGSAVLDPKKNAVKPGDMIKIVYLGKGEAKSGKNAPKLYDVYIDYEYREKNQAVAPVLSPASVPTQAVAQAITA